VSLSIFDRGDGRFDLMRGNNEIGWVEVRAIGFTGFRDRPAARRAAAVGYDALQAWLARQRRTDRSPRNGHTLREHPRGPSDQLSLGDVPVGRLLVRGADGGTSLGSYASGAHAFELFLPPRLGATLSAAQVVYYALDRRRLIHAGDEIPTVA
jgi:hypothetical protein